MRREEDQPQAPTDRYGSRLVGTVLAILALSGLDAAFTLILLKHGVVHEWNPFMRVLIEKDVQLFANVKTALTASALILLVPCHASAVFGRIRVRRIIDAMAVMYAALVTYEIVLLTYYVW